MVAFGKKLKERQIQEWQGYYINYKLMKKKVKQYARQIEAGGLERRYVLKDFSRMLDNQIEKIVLFLLEQQGLLASRLSKLGEEQESLHEEPDISKISDLREAYRAVGRDLLQLLYFVEINAIGLRKILKKFDKRFGYRFTDYYVKTRANHPYSQLQQVFKHVGLGAVVGAVSRNLADLQDRQGSYLSIYDQSVLSLQIQSRAIYWFYQVSFVNSISTIKGGIHVDYVTNQIFNHVMNLVNKKNKNVNLKAYIVENHLWVFVNALIDNPTFDSHTKETLTIRQSSFGSKCEPSQEFLKKVAKSGVVKSLLSWADYKQSKDLKNTNGAKRERITGITKLEDVNDAGGKNSAKYTLILTEGDSS